MANFRCYLKTAIACLALGIVHVAWADPPGRVGRISYIGGTVSFKTAGDTQWTQATPNFPVATGAAFWTDAGSLAEIQIGSSALQMDQATKLEFTYLDDHAIQVRISQGTLAVKLRNLDRDDSFKVVTLDGMTVSLLSAGRYRVDAARSNQPLRVTAFEGSVQIENNSSAVIINEGKTAIVSGGTGVIRHEIREAIPVAFDDWTQSRNRVGTGDNPSRYVSQEMTGSEELSSYGQWSTDPEYGPVWNPYDMPTDWAPYRFGHWSWVEPWGWTWIDDAPWGFAPFHYGRWAFINGSWSWVPGLFIVHPVFAPALVTFIRSPHLVLPAGSPPLIAWFPLAPGQAFVPSFPCSTACLQRINLPVSSRLVTINTQPVNLTQITPGNGRLPQGVTVIPRSAFAKTLSVAKSTIRLPANATSPVVRVTSSPSVPARTALVSASVNSAQSFTGRSMLTTADSLTPARTALVKPTATNSTDWPRQNRVSRDMPAQRQTPAPTVSQVRSNTIQSAATSALPSVRNSNRVVTQVNTQSPPVTTPMPTTHPSPMPAQNAVMQPSTHAAESGKWNLNEAVQSSVVGQPFYQPVRRSGGLASFRSPG